MVSVYEIISNSYTEVFVELCKKKKMVVISLSGSACTGKTSYVSEVPGRLNKKVQIGDYVDHKEIYPAIKDRSTPITMAYLLFLLLNIEENVLTERTPIDVLVYLYVHRLLRAKMTTDEVYKDIDKWVPMVRGKLETWKVGVLLWNGPLNEMVNRMVRRANGVDILHKDYVTYQTLIFTYVANCFGWRKFYINTNTSYIELEEQLDSYFFSTNEIEFKLQESIPLPTRSTPKAAGLDIYSPEDVVLTPKTFKKINTKFSLALPQNTYGRISSRSGLMFNHYISVFEGVIDEDYRGNIEVLLFNYGDQEYLVKKGDRIAQLICQKISYPIPISVQNLNNTSRGGLGFGSTGQ